ncbi:SDR family NAD(P)-dependent oxidoreductase [Hyphomonas sp. ND6WE1B]|uniref:SDR family NAD(P)-dependent oxidoreductase n=1 Tax=Hyphomonas sp. ND6WE1B TaxID=1848191 RepID=UPI000807713A|nr:SDR family NAD(P)-dependent oxidoreductase [Hyphomonas sp. ND6WE1B]
MTGMFNAQSTTDEVLEGVDLSGKRFLITGVSSGLGVETARALVAHGASVTGAVRDLAKAHAATDEVREAAASGGGQFSLIELDLASLSSVRSCADKLVHSGAKFDVVIANAGVMATPFGYTADGFETQFGTNHLGHFLLVNRIAPLINDGGRLVNLSSAGHRISDVDLEDPDFEHTPYDPWIAYGRSKTANVLFAVEFDRRHQHRGVRACALMPGAIATNLGRHLTESAIEDLIRGMKEAGAPDLVYKTIPQGAATTVWAAAVAGDQEIGGKYCEDCGVAPVTDGEGIRYGAKAYALDSDRASALWDVSEEMVGERF